MVCQGIKKKNIERDFDSTSTRFLHNRLLKSFSMFKKKKETKKKSNEINIKNKIIKIIIVINIQ